MINAAPFNQMSGRSLIARDSSISSQQAERLILEIREHLQKRDFPLERSASGDLPGFTQPLSKTFANSTRLLPSQDIEVLIENIRAHQLDDNANDDSTPTKINAAEYRPEELIFFGLSGKGKRYQGPGWHLGEPLFTWSEAEQASLHFQLPTLKGDLMLEFTANGYINRKIGHQDVVIEINGIPHGTTPVSVKRTVSIPISNSTITGEGLLVVQFSFPLRASPSQFKRRADHRILGMALHSLAIRELRSAKPAG